MLNAIPEICDCGNKSVRAFFFRAERGPIRLSNVIQLMSCTFFLGILIRKVVAPLITKKRKKIE